LLIVTDPVAPAVTSSPPAPKFADPVKSTVDADTGCTAKNRPGWPHRSNMLGVAAG
jgi:hypothetical protein